jgi:hypothetical protein
MPTDTPEQLEKAERVREKILNNFQNKFLFNVEPNYMPVDKIVENDRLVGLVFQRTEIKDGRVVPVEGDYKEVHSDLVISSIGSLPELLPGIPNKYQVFDIDDEAICRIKGYRHVFALGNAVTGRGNINESQKHGKEITQRIIEDFFQLSKDEKEQQLDKTIDKLEEVALKNALREEQYASTISRVKELQASCGYSGNFQAWVSERMPRRLEEILGIAH